MTPNQMSAASVVAAVLGAVAYGGAVVAPSAGAAYLVAAATFIQWRLLANLLDGLMAVEEGKRTPTGVLYNEFPDRIADTVLLAGYASRWPAIGWLAAAVPLTSPLTYSSLAVVRQKAQQRPPREKENRWRCWDRTQVETGAQAR
jgi:phosphatidylglycerophosphate synthase